MGRGGKVDRTEADFADDQALKVFKWEEIKQNKWIVIEDLVYDVSRFSRKHPGGERLMLNHAGQDATVGQSIFFLLILLKLNLKKRMLLVAFIMI